MLKYYKKLPNPLGFVAKRLVKWETGIMNDYIASIMEQFQKEPEVFAAMLKKPLELLADDFVKNRSKSLAGLGTGILPTGNAMIDIAQVILPMFGAKGRMAAKALPLLPLLQGKKQSNDVGKNPFDR